MSTATLRFESIPDFPEVVRLVVDCRHGTTYCDQFTPVGMSQVISERTMIAWAVERHELEEGCGCARGLDTLTRARRGARA